MTGGAAVLPDELWARSAVCTVRHCLDRLRRLIAAQPAAGLLAVVWLIGIYAIIVGIMHIGVYFESRSLASSLA